MDVTFGGKFNLAAHFGTFDVGAENAKSTSTAAPIDLEALENNPDAAYPDVSATPGDGSTLKFSGGGLGFEVGGYVHMEVPQGKKMGGFFVEAGVTVGTNRTLVGERNNVYSVERQQSSENELTPEENCLLYTCPEGAPDQEVLTQTVEKSSARHWAVPIYLDISTGFSNVGPVGIALTGGVGVSPYMFTNGQVAVEQQRQGEDNLNPDGMDNQAVSGQSILKKWPAARQLHWRAGVAVEVISKDDPTLGNAGLRVYAQYAHTGGGALQLDNPNVDVNSEFTTTGQTGNRIFVGGSLIF